MGLIMLRMNKHFNSAATSFLVTGYAPQQNACMRWGHVIRRSGGFDKLTALPSGYGRPNDGLAPPAVSGAISSKVFTNGLGELTISLAAGIGISGLSDGSGDLTGSIQGLAWGNGSTLGDSNISAILSGYGLMAGLSNGDCLVNGSIFAAVSIQGTATGLGDITGTGYLAVTTSGIASGTSELTISLAALLSISGTASGSSEASGSLFGGYFISGVANGISTVAGELPIGYGWMTGNANGDSNNYAIPFATGSMSGSTDVITELTTDNIASAVWNTLSLQFNETGTMGNKLNTASSGGVDLNALAESVWGYER